ncbi:MAG TPA: rhodanese-like domain-containing protein [Symbiobacteriaceae bacterium]
MFGFLRPRVQNITTAELEQRLKSGEKLTIIDVREPWEYAEGHIPGSLLRPLGQIQNWAQEFQKDQPLILICRSGGRSAQAYQYLAAQGFTNLKNVDGGIVAWRGPVER